MNMKKIALLTLCLLLIIPVFISCNTKKTPKIGVAFGVGPASRWPQEIQFMTDYAMELGIEIETRLNTDEEEKPLAKDCFELIDSGVDALIIRPRNVHNMKDVVAYAQDHNVKVISYDSLIEAEPVDLFIGYDSEHTGNMLGKYLTEIVTSGDYILLWGDPNRNVDDMYRGAMKCLAPLKDDINILLETGVAGWSPEEAKKIVKETVSANGNNVNAIFAFNDKLAGACAEAVSELGVKTPVVIAGMDAELDAARRIVAGTQSCTAYMDFKELAYAAIDEAVHLAVNEDITTNCETDNDSGSPIPSYLLARQLVTRQNLDRVLIESGYFTTEQVYEP